MQVFYGFKDYFIFKLRLNQDYFAASIAFNTSAFATSEPSQPVNLTHLPGSKSL